LTVGGAGRHPARQKGLEVFVKLIEVKTLAIPEIKVVRFGRFADHRGYFTEHYRKTDFAKHEGLASSSLRDADFVQANESYSRRGTMRGLHFQWNPYVGKLVRTVHGRMIDLVLDIRRGSPTVGKILAYDIPANPEKDFGEWIWVPPGFAHGNFFPEETLIEYLCTGQWNPACEAGISPLSPDIDWSLCDPQLYAMFVEHIKPDHKPLLTDKDRDGFTVAGWLEDPRSEVFVHAAP
jgi:dTDP-4-dehydrorhamnose 3,5-epimerase